MTCKISQKEHQPIIDLYRKNYGTKDIGNKYGVTSTAICDILKKHNVKIRSCWWESKTYKPFKNYFNYIDDEYKAYFLGLLWADGCNNGRGIFVSLQEGDEDVLRKMSEKIFVNKRPLTFISGRNGWKNSFRLTIYDRGIVTKLESFGLIMAKSLILKYPRKGVITKNLFRHFLRGYFDGDGWVSINKYRKYRTIGLEWGILGTYSFISSMKRRMENGLKIKINNQICKHSSIFRLRIAREDIIRRIYCFLYNDATIYLSRKKEKFKEYFFKKNLKIY